MKMCTTSYIPSYLYSCRSEAVEKELQLRTKKMRERDEMKMTVRHYRFVLLRIKFLDGIILQGVCVCLCV